MAIYSAFFSSGLLAPYQRATTPAPPSSPIPIPSSPMDLVDRALSVTPTPNSTSTNVAAASIANVERPLMRRRRSSINIAAKPMALIKSPTRNAGFALQRTGVMSPSRSRAGSVAEGASESNSLFGRLRNGSLNTGAPMRLRRAVKRTVPLAPPPPTAPLPALPPPSPSAKYTSTFPSALIAPSPSQSLTSYFSNAPELLGPDSAIQITSQMSLPISSSPTQTYYHRQNIDEVMTEN